MEPPKIYIPKDNSKEEMIYTTYPTRSIKPKQKNIDYLKKQIDRNVELSAPKIPFFEKNNADMEVVMYKRPDIKRKEKVQSKPKSKSETPKQKLDRIFSEYIRLSYANRMGMVMCVTCQEVRYWNDNMDAGHFIPRGSLSTRYDETNVYPQCKSCNRFNNGQPELMGEHIASIYGPEHLEVLLERSKMISPYYPFEEKITFYREKVKALKIKLNIK